MLKHIRKYIFLTFSSIMAMDNCHSSEHLCPTARVYSSSKPQRRLGFVFRVVYFTIACSKKHIHSEIELVKRVFSRNLSYVAIDMGSETHEPLIHNDAITKSPPTSPVFSIDQKTLTSMTKSKDLEALSQLGGVHNLARMLSAKDDIIGVSSNDTEHLIYRKRDYGTISSHKNLLKKPFLSFVIQSFKGIPTPLQVIFAVLSLGFGIKLYGRKQGWYDGGGIFISVFLTLLFSAVIKFKHSQVLGQLSDKIDKIRVIPALRDGNPQLIPISEVVVGDVIFLKIGDNIPIDGLLLSGFSLKVVAHSNKGDQAVETIDENTPFLLSGSKVVHGHGKVLVTSVSCQNDMDDDDQHSIHQPLQAHIEKLKFYITTIGLVVAVLHFVVLELRFFTGGTKDQNENRPFKARETKIRHWVCAVVKHISGALTIAVAANPEGLPLAVLLTLSCFMKKMLNLNILMKLAHWQNIGSVSVICTDKTGLLTLGELDVSDFRVGKDKVERPFKKKLTGILHQLLLDTIRLNTSGGATRVCYELPSEKAILNWGSELGIKTDDLRNRFEVLKVEAYNSERHRNVIIARKKRDHTVHVHFKGAAKKILANCSDYYDLEGNLTVMGAEDKKTFEDIIKDMENNCCLTCIIAFACKQIDQADLDSNMMLLNETGLSLIALVGLKDKYRPGILKAVESCRNARVSVKLVTGDDITTAKACAKEIGILEEIDSTRAVINGTDFRNYSEEERYKIVDFIQVMASATPEDKLLFVKDLKQKKRVVAFMDDGTSIDTPALKEADIRLIMVTESTQVIAEDSDIVVLDRNFCSIVTILRWGRCLLNNIRKVIQVQLTITAVGCITSLIIAATSGTVPLLWANMMVDTLAALALATEQPIGKDDDIMEKEPSRKADQRTILTKAIWRNIIGQTVYQVIVLLTLQYKGKFIFGVHDGVRNTLIFNCFVLLQVFNECNARRLEKKNIFEGILRNRLFWGIIGFTIALQVIMVELLCKFSNTERLNGAQWAACVAVAGLSLPVSWLVKCILVTIPLKSSTT